MSCCEPADERRGCAPAVSARGYAPIGAAIGAYDGFFGPGTGSFFTASLVGLRGSA
jgi:uncharacterized membrane protein YfcA